MEVRLAGNVLTTEWSGLRNGKGVYRDIDTVAAKKYACVCDNCMLIFECAGPSGAGEETFCGGNA